MSKVIRVVTRASNGTLRTKEFEDFTELSTLHDQIGIDDCSTDLTLRGMPVFRGLIGPMPESKTVVLYESPEVFECLTKEWAQAKPKQRRRRTKAPVEQTEPAVAKSIVPVPKMLIGNPMSSPTVNL